MDWFSKIVKQTPEKIISADKDQLKRTLKELQKTKGISYVLQYYISTIQMQPYSKFCEQSEKTKLVVFVTQNLRSCLPQPEIIFRFRPEIPRGIWIKNNGGGSIFVGQKNRHVTTRIQEHQKKNSQVGQHLVEFCGATHDFEWKNLDAWRTVENLFTIEAI